MRKLKFRDHPTDFTPPTSRRKRQPLDTYYPTLGEALNAVRDHYDIGGDMLLDGDFTEPFNGGVSYEETKESHTEIVLLNGKGTRKWLHVILYRMPSGNYELTSYTL